MDLITILGTVAIIGSTMTQLPQIFKIYKTRSAQDVSLLGIVVTLITSALWLMYGLLIQARSVWLNNVFIIAFGFLLLWLKLRFSRRID